MVLLPARRSASSRASTRSAAHLALSALGVAGLILAIDAAPAVAAHPRHGTSSHTGHATTRHGRSGAKGSASRTSAGHHTERHNADRAHTRSAHRHDARRHLVAEVAQQAPPAIAIPQFALPDLAIAATTYPAGRTLAGFGGPTETAMVPQAAAARTLSALTHSAASLLDALVSRARSQLGTRYVFGGAEPGAGLDCSSFARYAMEALGIRLPRTANQQAQIGRPIPRDPNLLRPGDLLTFGSRSHVSHVGIYLGEGRFIHASVSHGQIIETTIDRNRSLFRRWQGARRLLAAASDSAGDPGTTGG